MKRLDPIGRLGGAIALAAVLATLPAGATGSPRPGDSAASARPAAPARTGVAWGKGAFGQLGDGKTSDRQKPVKVKKLTERVIDLAGGHGGDYSLALGSNGGVWSWGRNLEGELGDGSKVSSRATPKRIPGLSGVKAIAAGAETGFALKKNGTVFAWGDNKVGQTGSGEQAAVPTNQPQHRKPVQVANLNGVMAIAAGGGHALALKRDGTVWAWGLNTFGGIGSGFGGAPVQFLPTQVVNLTGVKAIGAGGEHSIAVKRDGTVWEWGAGAPQSVMIPIPATRPVPEQVLGPLSTTKVKAVAGGQDFSLAIAEDGALYSWGGNNHGELGNGSAGGYRAVPARVAGLSGVKAIDAAGVAAAGTAGGGHSLAIRRDGSLWGWGQNSSGQVGDGTKSDRSKPVRVRGLSRVTEIAAGAAHSLAIAKKSRRR